MKYFSFVILLSFSFFSSGFAQKDTLTILFASDTHSNLAPIGERSVDLKGSIGGIARAASLIGLTKMSEPNVLTIHGGDAFIGDIFYNAYFGIAELQLMSMIGYDVMMLGNHEFDLGPAMLQMALDSSMTESPMTIISSNAILPEPPILDLKKYIHQHAVKKVGNITVGFFGLTTPETNFLSSPSPVLFDEHIIECAVLMIDSLKQMGCSVIICVSHLGFMLDEMIVTNVPGIDLIIGAHDHRSIPAKAYTNPTGDSTWITQANAFYTEMGKVQLLVSDSSIQLLSSVNIPLDNAIPEEPTIAGVVNNLVAEIEQSFGPMFSEQIGFAEGFFNEVPEDLMGTENKETAIGNLVTAAFREYTNTDIAIEPGGSTAQPLYQGPIVADDLFRVVGYGFNETNYLGFRLVTFSITGESLFIALEKCLATMEINDEFFPQVSGMSYSVNSQQNPGSRVNWIKVDNIPLDLSKRYTVTTNELAVQLLTTFLDINISNVSVLHDVSEYQAILAYVSSRNTISPEVGSKIINTVEINYNRQLNPEHFRLDQNYPNPFNPTTTITFELPVRSNVTLRIYDVLGKEVETLIDKVLEMGSYKTVFHARQLSSGVYYYTLRTDNGVQTRNMVLMK